MYFLSRNYLEFELLTETEVNIYTGKGKADTADEGDFNMSQLRLIQRFPDEFSPDNYRNLVEEKRSFRSGGRDRSRNKQ